MTDEQTKLLIRIEMAGLVIDQRCFVVLRTESYFRGQTPGGLLPARAIDELEKFFEATNALEEMELEFLGWRGGLNKSKALCRTELRRCLNNRSWQAKTTAQTEPAPLGFVPRKPQSGLEDAIDG